MEELSNLSQSYHETKWTILTTSHTPDSDTQCWDTLCLTQSGLSVSRFLWNQVSTTAWAHEGLPQTTCYSLVWNYDSTGDEN